MGSEVGSGRAGADALIGGGVGRVQGGYQPCLDWGRASPLSVVR